MKPEVKNGEKVYRGKAMRLKWLGDTVIIVANDDEALTTILAALFPSHEPKKELWREVEVRKAKQ